MTQLPEHLHSSPLKNKLFVLLIPMEKKRIHHYPFICYEPQTFKYIKQLVQRYFACLYINEPTYYSVQFTLACWP